MQQPTPPAPAPAKPKPPQPPVEFQEGAIATADAATLLAILKDASSSEFKKAKACTRLGELGAKEAVPALAALLPDDHLSTYARYGLEPIADPSVDDALRAALPKLKGNHQIGVINSISKRRDAKAAPMLAKYLASPDPALSSAAASALGSIATPDAIKALKAAGPGKPVIADSLLVAAERLMEKGNRDEALALYQSLTVATTPKPMRLAAMAGIIREETATTRPR